MREVLYRNLTSLNSKKRDIFLREVFVKDGVVARTERRCQYFIRDIIHLDKPADLQKWASMQGEVGMINRRQFYVYKKHKDDPGEDRLVCKILGNFYAVVNNAVYTIVFLQSFRICFSKSALT